MLNANGSILADNRSSASQWAQEALGLPEVQVQARLRGNHLHILCEAAQCPSQELVTARFTNALEHTDLTRLLPDRPKIYQLFLCGRKIGSRQNDWTVRLDCSSPQRQQQPQPQQPEPKVAEVPPPVSSPEEPPGSSKRGGFFGKFNNDNHKLKHTPKPVETSAHPPQVREELDFDAESLPIASRIQYPEVFETSAVTIDTSAAATREAFSSAVPPQQKASRGAVALIQSPEADSGEGDRGGTLTVSPETLARRGYPDAIASYLSEILGPMGVSVKVSIREKELKSNRENLPAQAPENIKPKERRLLVLCESAYSPDPSLLAEPIAGRLRKLQLEDFREALIGSQVSGEAKPDWVLRVDLTSPDKILKEWARWGDVPAIAKLLNQHLAASRVEVRATLKEATLHLFCSKTAKKGQKTKRQEYPDKQQTTDTIAPLLASFAPQGLRAATIYGVEPAKDSQAAPESPVWIDWVDLPAAHHPDLAASTRTLAAEGDQLALTFLLNRLLNPSLRRKLETGGIRAVVLQKADVLHVMTEALTCPSQSKVGPPVAKFLRQLQIPGVSGVRVYGRRAGQKLPLWRYAIDLRTAVDEESATAPAPAPSQVAVLEKEPVPEFASAEDGSFSGLGDNLVFDAPAPNSWRPRFKIRLPGYNLGEQLVQAAVQPLVASGLFVPNDGLSTNAAAPGGVRADRAAGMALIWAIAGCLLTFNTDWLLGLFLQSATVSQAPSASEVCKGPNCQNSAPKALGDVTARLPNETPNPVPTSGEVNLPQTPLQPSPEANQQEAFNGSGFTKPGNTSVPVADVSAPAVFPTLRSQQLDEQIARYQEYIHLHKKPPDILIVGSSRALRGIDPAVLETALAASGYPGLRAYNFGVNGATLQVVDSLIRRILPPQQLPKLLVLADGARALNSGRPDLTFSAIASSEGYRQLSRGSFLIRTNQLESETSNESANNPVATATELVNNLGQTQAKVQQLVSQKLVESSAIYKKRDRLKGFLRSLANPSAPVATEIAQTPALGQQTTENSQPTAASKPVSEFQPNGFLPIDIRFNPETYFQKHPKVSGYYDSDYQNFKLIGEQALALKNLIEFTKVRNINLVFVNMPLTEDYLDPVRTGYEQEFRQYMQELAAQSGLIFLDNSLLWPQARESFSDPSHLNRYGAIAVSKRLAQDPMIPWPAKQ
ncbi:hypothetical protein D0A34_21310 [Microcoleus vaginatus PCC 9802]|uniref:hypothetical protein n=1 Tax=Microcoleus vaginatus TaxID=119532 RepID=UPI00020D2E8C|nr:hypothetical protein MicvaDRAFT_4903 [Microcoleus vaginatus FGP-2]UNU21034.1 hypothetical protein D0A34_21310 [Microcoleus vaginatus PCC 9802]